MFVRGTTLIIFPTEDHFRLQQVLSRNGGIRVPLLTMRSRNRLGNQIAFLHPHRLAPNAGSLEHLKEASFPSLPFTIYS